MGFPFIINKWKFGFLSIKIIFLLIIIDIININFSSKIEFLNFKHSGMEDILDNSDKNNYKQDECASNDNCFDCMSNKGICDWTGNKCFSNNIS